MTRDERTIITDDKRKKTDVILTPLQRNLYNLHMGNNPVFETGRDLANKEKSPQFPLLAVDDDESILAFYYDLFTNEGYNYFILCKQI